MERIEDYVDEENPVRAIEAFIDALDLEQLGFHGMNPKVTGRPAYHPATMLKLYVYLAQLTMLLALLMMTACLTNQEDQIEFKKYGQSIEITFPNMGDGIQLANLNKAWHFSDYTFHYNAPESGYQDSLVGFYTEANGKATEQYVKDDFYIRIRSKSDDLGNVVEAIYCKIREGILPAGYLDKTNAALGFTYYCNPTPNDTNVEFDPRKNLSTTLGKYNYVDEP